VARVTFNLPRRLPTLRLNPPADGEPQISVADARTQVVGIVKERQFDPDHAAKLDALIDRLAEPSPSRMTGEATINLLRLNLALDELR